MMPTESLVADAEPEFVAATLAWCNTIRAEQGRDPLERLPKGERKDPESCPCGRATGLYVDHMTYGSSKATRESRRLPDEVIEFIGEFDQGFLPQYDEHPRDEYDEADE